MRSVIYARYSSDKQREASIDDQVRNCRHYADREGWTITKVYDDKAISGTKSDRPGYQAMLSAATAKEFDVLLVDDLSRLSRDDVETKKATRRLKHWGIRIVGVSDGVDSGAKGYKIQAGMRSLINESYLDDLREKTHRGLAGNALAGKNTGGRSYGYKHVPTFHPTKKDEYGRPHIEAVRREVDPEQAKVVREIFRLFAEGHGYRAIASKLNAGGIPSPRGKTWAGSAIRPILTNQTYIGQLIWNRREYVRDPDTYNRQPRLRPETEWIITAMPNLRIVDDRLWQRVQDRRKAMLEAHNARQKSTWHDSKTNRTRGGENTRPGKVPQYLLSDIVVCGECGGRYIKANKSHYRCSHFINRGASACSNNTSVRKDVLEQRLLHAIKTELFDDDSFDIFKTEVRRILQERLKVRNKDAGKLQRELATVERQIENMVGFIKAGTITTTLSAELTKAEGEKKRLLEMLEADLPPVDGVEEILADALGRYATMALNLEEFAARDVTKARTMIKALVGGTITLQPTAGGGLNAELRGDYGGLIELVANESPGARGAGARSKVRMVAGRGFEPLTFRL